MVRTVRFTLVLLGALGVAALALLATVLVTWSGDVDQFLVMALLGGVLIAAMLLGTRSMRPAQPFTADRFAGDVFSSDPVNYAHVRVAGIGGVGLMLAALVMALQYPLTTAAVAAGLVGGLACAIILIVHRRRAQDAH